MNEQHPTQKHSMVLLAALLLKMGGKAEISLDELRTVSFYDGITIIVQPHKGIRLEVDRGGDLN